MPLQGRGAVAIERRADLGRQPREIDLLRMEAAALVVEVVHRACRRRCVVRTGSVYSSGSRMKGSLGIR